MNYENDIVDFIASPENIEYAFEIAEQIDKVKQKLMTEFWTSLIEKMENFLSKSKNSDWIVNDLGIEYWNNYAGYDLSWRPSCTPINLKLSLSQEHVGYGNFKLFWGVLWNREFKSDPEIELVSLNNLKSYFEEQKHLMNGPHWSIGWNWYELNTVNKEFCIRFSREKEAIILQVHDFIQSKFEDVKKLMEDANKELKKEFESNNEMITNALNMQS